MPIRSMTGFAQVKGQAGTRSNGDANFILAMKSVNHRFLDLHFRLPADSDALEVKLRRLLKEKLARGHVEVTLNVERNSNAAVTFNRELAGGYVAAFRAAAQEFGLPADPDLNSVLRLPGVLDSAPAGGGELEAAVFSRAPEVLHLLNQMREEEGKSIERELRQLLARIKQAGASVSGFRAAMLKAYSSKLRSRIHELLGAEIDSQRVLQEAALLVDRSDVQEEVVRMEAHVDQFSALLNQGGEVGKKLDFLLQEMNREANTLLSKTSGLAGEALKITGIGLAMKADIEKAREQVQNLE